MMEVLQIQIYKGHRGWWWKRTRIVGKDAYETGWMGPASSRDDALDRASEYVATEKEEERDGE